jgi:hypothetical protein
MVLGIWVDKNCSQQGRQKWSWAFGSTKTVANKVDKNDMYDIKVDNESGELFFLFEILVTVFTNVKK